MSYIKKEKAVAFLRGEAIRKYPASFALGIGAAANGIEDMEESDVVEVRHGYNTMRCNSMFECSVCGWQDFDTFLADGDFYFCPHCGAKMDGERREG